MLTTNNKKKLILGTAQFGLKYGITNKKGKTPLKEIKKIIKLQKKNKINFLDTAQAYNFEKTHKNLNLKNFNLIIKLNPFQNKKNADKLLINSVMDIKKSLKMKNIFCLMVHHSKDLLMEDGDKLYKALKYLKDKKITKKIGFSTYGTENIFKILKKFKFDVVQTTFNPFDRRILKNGIYKRLKKKGIEVHVRSIFLQGLLLLKKNKIPNKLRKFENQFKKWNNFVKNTDIKPLDICLNYALSQNFDKIIVGINNCKQFKQILDCKSRKIKIPTSISTNKNFLINPYNWS